MARRISGLLERLLARRREPAGEGVPDSELLRRFARDRDEAAFELLVWRHGGMVFGVCRRTIRDEQLAEDAFQAVFLVLARQAGTVRGNLGGWLFKVARRVAARALKNRVAVRPVTETVAAPLADPAERDELAKLLDAEIARLPQRLRRPVVLCYLGGCTTEVAAREIGCPRGTVLSRLATARKRLAARLTRRGVALPAALATAGLSGRLVSSARASASQFRTGSLAFSTASQLAEGVARTMSRTTLLTVTGAALVAALVSGIGWVAASAEPGTATHAGAPPAPHTADPPPPARAVAPAAKESDDGKRANLQAALGERIAQAEKLLDRDALQAASSVDASALQAELVGIDRTILQAEKDERRARASVEYLTKKQAEVSSVTLSDNELINITNSLPIVRKSRERVSIANGALKRVHDLLTADHVIVKAAEKEVAEATAQFNDTQKEARKEAEAIARANLKAELELALSEANRNIEGSQRQLQELQERRKLLVERITAQRQREAKREQLQDELRVLRQIRLDLLRHEILSTLGVDAPTQSGGGTQLEKEIKDLRRQIEMLRGEVEKLRTGKKN